MTTAAIAKVDNKIPLHTETTVRRLDEFPELAPALRDGDLLTGRLFCAQLFNLDLRRDHVDEVAPALQATMKASEETVARRPKFFPPNNFST